MSKQDGGPTTHAQRLREIAVWHDRQAAAWERTCNASPDAFSRDLMLFHREAAAFLRAAAGVCPHKDMSCEGRAVNRGDAYD